MELNDPLAIEENEELNLTLQESPFLIAPDAVDHQADKISYTLDKPTDEVKDTLLRGDEEALRRSTALDRSIKRGELNAQILENYITSQREKNQEVKQEEIDFILNLTDESEANLKVVLEEEYARKVSNDVVVHDPDEDGFLSRVVAGDSDANLVLDSLETITTQKEVVQRKYEELRARQQAQDTLPFVWEKFKTFVPFLTSTNLKDAVVDAPTSSFLPGSNLQEQAEFLYLLPPAEFERQLSLAVEGIAESNLNDALTFLAFIGNYSRSDVLLQNAYGVLDVIDVASIVVSPALFKGMARLPQGAKGVGRNLKEVQKALADRKVDPANVAAASGNLNSASLLTALDHLKFRVGALDKTGDQVDTMFSLLPALTNVRSIFRDSKTITADVARKQIEIAEIQSRDLLDAVTNSIQIDRLTGDQFRRALVQAKDAFDLHYPHLSSKVLEVSHTRIATPDGKNVANVDGLLVRLGSPEGETFKSINEAADAATNLYQLRDFRVVEHAPGSYYVELMQQVDETSPVIRSMLVDTDAEVKSNLATEYLGLLTSANNLVSRKIRLARHAATYGGNNFLKFFRSSANEIGVLRKDAREALNQFILKQKNTTHAGRVGVTSRTSGEFEQAWQKQFGRLPTQQEQMAYWNIVRLNDIDYIINNLSILREKSRAGFREWDIKLSSVADGIDVEAPKIEGKKVDDIEWDNPDDAGILILDDKLGVEQFERKNRKRTTTGDDVEGTVVSAGLSLRDHVRDLIDNKGFTLLHVTEKGERSLKAFKNVKETVGPEAVNYVLVRNVTSSPLDFRQLPHRPGFHQVYPDGWFIRQPIVHRLEDDEGVRHRYDGDINILNFATKKEADFWLERLEGYRKARLQGQEAINKYLKANYIPKSLVKKFDKEGFINPNIQFRTTFSGTPVRAAVNLSDEFDNLSFKADSSFNLYSGNVNLEFAGKRNPPIETIANRGTEDNPLFRLELARQLDVFETSDQALASLMRNRMLSDVKIASTEDWVRQFKGVLDPAAHSERDILNNPMAIMANPTFTTAREMQDTVRVAKNARRAHLQLMGEQTDLDKVLDHLRQKALEATGERLGKTGTDVNPTQPYMMAFIQDPSKYFRAAAFHTKLGFFNPVQLFLQAQTMTHIMGVAGINGIEAMPAMWHSRRLTMTKMASVMDGAAGNVGRWPGWTPFTFKESHEALMRSGFFEVGKEVTWRSDLMNPSLFTTRAGHKILEKSPMFFNEGERLARITGWHSAYLEWRNANPTKIMTPTVEKEILTRADDFTVNMSQASNAAWNEGLASIPTQFWSYQARLSEQVVPGLFNRGVLSRPEAIGSMMAHSMMYGFPIGLTGTTLGLLWPMHEEIREELLEQGVEVNDEVWQTFLTGVPQAMLRWATGQDFNVAERFGPGGIPSLKELWKGETEVLEALFGVSGSVAKDAMETFEPLINSMMGAFEDKDDRYPFTTMDIVEPLRNLSTANQALKALYAMNYGIYISRNETLLAKDVDWDEGLFQALVGLQRQEISDSFLKIESMKELRELQKEAKKQAVKEFRRGLRQDNQEEAEKFFRRAKWHIVGGGFLPSEHGNILSEALKGHTDLVEALNSKFNIDIVQRKEILKSIEATKDE